MTNYSTGDHETAPMITLVWGQALAPMVSAMILQRPSLAQRLTLAPRRVVHSVAAYLQHAREAEHGVGQIAKAVEQQDVRELLAIAVPNLHPRLYRMLERIGPVVRVLSYYQRLDALLHGPGAALLTGDSEVIGLRLDVAEQIVADPVLLAAQKAIEWSTSNAEMLANVLAYLRMTGLARDIEVLPPGSGWRAILRRVSSDLGRARAPKLLFESPPGWRHVESVAELWQVGGVLGNCVANLGIGGDEYVEGLISGSAVFLVHEDTLPTLACLRHVGPNIWVIAELSGAKLSSDGVIVRDALTDGLKVSIGATGGRLLEQPPLNSIRHLARRAAHVAEDGEVEVFEDAA